MESGDPLVCGGRTDRSAETPDDQQLAARELVDAVSQLLKEAILADESSETSWGDRLRVFSEAVLGLRQDGFVTDDQALELLSLFLAQIGETEVSKITSDLLDASLETVGRHINAGFETAPRNENPGTRMDVRAALAWSG